MYLVVGLCKLGTKYCVNFEQQRCKIAVYTAASAWDCSENAFGFEFEKKSVDFAWACFSSSRFTDYLPFKTVFFSAPRGNRKKQFLLYFMELSTFTMRRFNRVSSVTIHKWTDNPGGFDCSSHELSFH